MCYGTRPYAGGMKWISPDWPKCAQSLLRVGSRGRSLRKLLNFKPIRIFKMAILKHIFGKKKLHHHISFILITLPTSTCIHLNSNFRHLSIFPWTPLCARHCFDLLYTIALPVILQQNYSVRKLILPRKVKKLLYKTACGARRKIEKFHYIGVVVFCVNET